MQKRKGISLIVLVITIIVMIILAGAIILSLNNAGIINKANEAVEKTNLNQVQTLAQLKWTEAYLDEDVKNTTAGLREAVREALKEELGAQVLEDYKIKITASGVTVEEKENTEVLSTEELIGENGLFKYVKLANGDIQITRYIGPQEENQNVVIPGKYKGTDGIEYDVYAVGNVDAGTDEATRYNIFGTTNSTTNTTITSVTISEGIREIRATAFNGCSGLKGILILPSTLETIAYRAFSECSGLTGNLIIPEGVTAIGPTAFNYCTGLNGKLTLPSTLETIESGAFNHCENLTGELIIPEGVVSMANGVFQACFNLTSLKLPSTLTTVGRLAFNGCKSLDGILTIPANVTSIGAGTFQVCENLDGIVFEENSKLTTIGESAFSTCTSVTGNLTIPSGVTTIEKRAFDTCSSLTALTISPTLSNIGDEAFKNCSNLEGIITFEVTLVGNDVFYGCNKLTVNMPTT